MRERRACRVSLSGRRRCNAHTWALAGLLAMGREGGGGGGHATALLGAQCLHGSGAGEQQQACRCVVGVALLRWCWQDCGDGWRWGGWRAEAGVQWRFWGGVGRRACCCVGEVVAGSWWQKGSACCWGGCVAKHGVGRGTRSINQGGDTDDGPTVLVAGMRVLIALKACNCHEFRKNGCS